MGGWAGGRAGSNSGCAIAVLRCTFVSGNSQRSQAFGEMLDIMRIAAVSKERRRAATTFAAFAAADGRGRGCVEVAPAPGAFPRRNGIEDAAIGAERHAADNGRSVIAGVAKSDDVALGADERDSGAAGEHRRRRRRFVVAPTRRRKRM